MIHHHNHHLSISCLFFNDTTIIWCLPQQPPPLTGRLSTPSSAPAVEKLDYITFKSRSCPYAFLFKCKRSWTASECTSDCNSHFPDWQMMNDEYTSTMMDLTLFSFLCSQHLFFFWFLW